MTTYYDEDEAIVDDQFVTVGDTSIRVSEISGIVQQEDQPGIVFPIASILVAIVILLIWLPAPIANMPVGIVGWFFLIMGWLGLKRKKPREYSLIAKAGGFTTRIVFKSSDESKVNQFRSAIDASIKASGNKSATEDDLKLEKGGARS